jgi:transcriptional regulator with XRE-family HTH domain
MMKAKKSVGLRARMSLEARARSAAIAEGALVDMRLQQFRKSRSFTQEEPAKEMKADQATVSKVERRENLFINTLRRYIQALGGELRMVAKFPDAEIDVRRFLRSA